MNFEIKPATRTSVKPLVGLYSESGCGKTYSSLLLARGLVGPTGKIVLVDSESRRGSLYADVLPGGYEVLDLEPPFTPSRYVQALDCAEKSGAGIVVIDSMSHEWEGEGGVLDMAGDNEQRSGKSGLHNWKTPKLEHAKLILRLLRSAVPVVCCIRAKYKSRQTKNEQGKTVIIKDDFTSPIQAEDFIFEMTVHGEILPDHTFRLTKQSHPTLGACFPGKGQMISVENGQKLAAWCLAAGAPAKPQQDPEVKTLKARLWVVVKEFRGSENNWDKAQQWLWDEALMDPSKRIQDLNAAEMQSLIENAEKKAYEVVP